MLLAGFRLFFLAIQILYAIGGRALPPAFEILGWLLSGLLLAFFLKRDRALYGLRTPQDYGLLILLAWPIVVPYHFFDTRGRFGWRQFFVFVGVYGGSYVLVAAMYVAITMLLQ